MARKRIYEVARQYNISSDALIQMLRDLKHDVKSHMSVMDEKMILDVNMKFEAEKIAAREDQARKKLMAEKTEKPVSEKPQPGKSPVAAPQGPQGGPQQSQTAPAAQRPQGGPRPSGAGLQRPSGAGPQRPQGGPRPSGAGPQRPQGGSPRRPASPATAPARPATAPSYDAGGEDRARRHRSKRKKRPATDQREVEASVRRTLAQMDTGRVRRRRRRGGKDEDGEETDQGNLIQVPEFISAAELAEYIGVNPTAIVAKCFQMGLMITINQRLDMATLVTVAAEFGFELEEQAEYGLEFLEEEEKEEEEAELDARPPVVTIMGHVDHGKTSLLDYIRESNVIAGEAGGITQHIGAYEVELPQGKIAFLDTPGHEAFSAMRARGAQATDLVVLVVASDEEVMPQTVEAIDHAKAASVPIIVALNKMDLPTARPDRIKDQLGHHGLIPEEWGGETIMCEVSAKTGTGVDHLLEMILLQSEVLDLKANYNRRAQGVVIEAELDKGRGTMATVLIQQGVLKVGDPFVAGQNSGKVRALLNERGHRMESAGPSTPVQIMGFTGMPQVGDMFAVMESEQLAREISNKRQQLRRAHDYRQARPVTLEDIYHQIQEGQIQELPLVIKGDVGGSVEALSDQLIRLENDEVKIRIIHAGVGAINESDVLLATASNAIIIGFHVRPANARVRDLAEREKVDIRLYDIIYRVTQDVTAALEGMLKPEIQEKVVGIVEIREIFRVPRAGVVAGCLVQSGSVRRNASVRLVRDGVVVYDGTIGSLRRFKEDVREVQTGFECGLTIDGYQDLKERDQVEVYETQEVARQFQVR
ncbi:MAG: translation initiation factor IF-2 [candidate division Zixibacteria bacterium]|nr:translation initiation factor IF-2 [candidate division Zixibacteria bacterium]